MVDTPPTLQEKEIKPTASIQEVVPDLYYDGLSKVIVDAITLQQKSVEPTTQQQVITPSINFDGLSKVTVDAVSLQTKQVDSSAEEIQYIEPDLGYMGLKEVIINRLALQEKDVSPSTSTQEITPDYGYGGLSKVTIQPAYLEPLFANPSPYQQDLTPEYPAIGFSEVRIESAELQNKSVTPNEMEQTVTADENYYGLGQVNVDPIPREYIIPQGNLEINENNLYDVTQYASASVNVLPNLEVGTAHPSQEDTTMLPSENYDGFSSINIVGTPLEEKQIQLTNPSGVKLETQGTYCREDINIQPILQQKTTTINGTITADNGYVGLSSVVVNVSAEPDYMYAPLPWGEIKIDTDNYTLNDSSTIGSDFGSVITTMYNNGITLQINNNITDYTGASWADIPSSDVGSIVKNLCMSDLKNGTFQLNIKGSSYCSLYRLKIPKAIYNIQDLLDGGATRIIIASSKADNISLVFLLSKYPCGTPCVSYNNMAF